MGHCTVPVACMRRGRRRRRARTENPCLMPSSRERTTGNTTRWSIVVDKAAHRKPGAEERITTFHRVLSASCSYCDIHRAGDGKVLHRIPHNKQLAGQVDCFGRKKLHPSRTWKGMENHRGCNYLKNKISSTTTTCAALQSLHGIDETDRSSFEG